MIEQVVSYLIIFAVCMFAINVLSNIYNDIKNYWRNKQVEQKYREKARNYIKQKEQEEKKNKIYKYFGLFEFIFENCQDEEKIKKEYYHTIQEKLRIKYKQNGLQLYALNKLFFECGDFTIIDNLVNDLIEMFKYFENANNIKSIKTQVKISLFTKGGNIKFLDAQKILLELCTISPPNQVIVNDQFYNQYQKENLWFFEFHPKGLINLPKTNENMEIYRLLKRTN